jgi:hypothetical protein
MIDRSGLLGRAAAWMHARGWKMKLAKRGHEQIGVERTIVELQPLTELL